MKFLFLFVFMSSMLWIDNTLPQNETITTQKNETITIPAQKKETKSKPKPKKEEIKSTPKKKETTRFNARGIPCPDYPSSGYLGQWDPCRTLGWKPRPSPCNNFFFLFLFLSICLFIGNIL